MKQLWQLNGTWINFIGRCVFLLAFLLSVAAIQAQQIDLLSPLDKPIQETSGLLLINGKLITHNDSGNEPLLYEFDTATGKVERSILIENAINTDWEDICADDTFIYIGDFGNNLGNRTDLKIYRIAISDYLSKDTVIADSIAFNYADQTDFTSAQFSTNYDAEAFISLADSLFLFTKNWGNGKSYLYTIPKIPGNYAVQRIDSFDPGGLIGGADYLADSNSVVLCGYTFSATFFIRLQLDSQDRIAAFSRDELNVSGSFQLEGIAVADPYTFLISAEAVNNDTAVLYAYRFPKPIENSMDNASFHPLIYPNPTSNSLLVRHPKRLRLQLFTMNGQLVLSSKKEKLELNGLATGNYVLTITELVSGAQTSKQIRLQK